MSRGLGVLQKGILRLLLNRGPLLRARVLLSQLLGWQGRPGDNQVFDRGSIGKEAYNSGHASLSRSLERMRRRGLVQVYKNVSGYGRVVGLTTIGRQVAQEIAEEEKPEP